MKLGFIMLIQLVMARINKSCTTLRKRPEDYQDLGVYHESGSYISSDGTPNGTAILALSFIPASLP